MPKPHSRQRRLFPLLGMFRDLRSSAEEFQHFLPQFGKGSLIIDKKYPLAADGRGLHHFFVRGGRLFDLRQKHGEVGFLLSQKGKKHHQQDCHFIVPCYRIQDAQYGTGFHQEIVVRRRQEIT